MRIPSTRCWTARAGSQTCSRPRRAWRCPRARSRTTATCTGLSTSTTPGPRPGSSRSSEWRATSLAGTGGTNRPRRRTPTTPSPRPFELLAEHSEGLICLSGCLSAEIPSAIVNGDLAGARRKAAQYRDVFGDRFYLELQEHGLPVQRGLNDELVRMGKEMGIQWVATNDSHYTHRDDAQGHEVLLCINTGSVLSDPNRFKFDSDDFYLKTPEEMRRRFERWPGACETTLEIADRCNVEIKMGNHLLPRFHVPDGYTLDGYLAELVMEGARKRYPDVRPEVRARAEYELKVIEGMGFAGYFLVVQDFVNWSKEQGIRVGPGRGSAAGSLVSYALGITELDPLRYNLMFERFLNPERVEMPDIDIDFDERRRGDVIRYVQDKYGSDHVAQIITYGTIKGKQAIS